MLEEFNALTVDYYGRQVSVCQLANISQDGDKLIVRLFDPSTMDTFIQLAFEFGWEYTSDGSIITYTQGP